MTAMPRPPLLAFVLALAGLTALALEARADDPSPARPARGRHLDLQMDRYAHDFGFVKQDDIRTTTLTYTNASNRVVKGIKARGECGCSVLKASHEELAPGAKGTLQVEFNTYTLGGRMRKRVRITSKDYRRGEIVIDLDIRIMAGLVVRPPGVSYREVPQESLPVKSFYLRWYEGHGQPFEVTSVTVPGYEDTFTTSIQPWRDLKDPKWQGWQVDVQMAKKLPLGNFSAEVLVRTTHPERARLTLPLNGNVVGKLWIQSRAFSFGTVRMPSDKRSSLKLKPYKKDVVLKNPRTVSRKGKVIVEVMPDPYMAKAGMWKLVARIAPNAPAGPLDDEVIELHTGVPGEEIVLFKVRGEIRAAEGAASPKGTTDGR